MTPDAVLQRYMQVTGIEPLDVEVFLRLVSVDPDLLESWVRLLGCEVTAAGLRGGVEALEPESLAALARAQIWALQPKKGRKAFAAWCDAVRDACLGEILATHADIQDGLTLRLKVLLVRGGVRLDQDPLLRDLADFRGSRLELVEDAAPVFRILAIVDTFAADGEAAAARVANRLLKLDESTFADALTYAEATAQGLIAGLGIVHQPDPDWMSSIARQQAVLAFANVLSAQANIRDLELLHSRISPALFGGRPRTYLFDTSDGALVGNEDPDGVRISVDDSHSVIARAVREHRVLAQSDGPEVAVVDRQLLRRLDAARIIVAPMRGSDSAIGALVFSLRENEARSAELDESSLSLYARAYGRAHATLLQQNQRSALSLDSYRAAQEKRLREIVHEANSPLAIVRNYLHIIKSRFTDDASVEQFDAMSDAVARAASIFQQARILPPVTAEVAVPLEINSATVDLNEVVDSVVRLVAMEAKQHGILVESELEPSSVQITTDRQRVAQVVTNLLRNAIEAFEATSGRVRITTRRGIYREGRAGVEFVVRDNGPGLPEDVLANLFLPKESRKGGDHAGLGLHIVARLVSELQGSIDVRTLSRRGTAFTVFLPLSLTPGT